MSDIVLFIPVYNPPAGWEILFAERYMEFRSALQKNISVWLINDGSVTPMQEGVEYLKTRLGNDFHYLEYDTNKGKGAALKFAATRADAGYYMFTDIDFPYAASSMVRVCNTLLQKGGIVTGFREEAYYADLSPFRTFLSKTLRLLNSAILGLPVNDTQCGLKGFNHEVRNILLTCNTNRFLIDLELLLAVSKNRLPITPVKVDLRDDTNFTKFNTGLLLRELASFVKIILKYRIM
jgi:hypothetical protein